jgi:hypothetical protein
VVVAVDLGMGAAVPGGRGSKQPRSLRDSTRVRPVGTTSWSRHASDVVASGGAEMVQDGVDAAFAVRHFVLLEPQLEERELPEQVGATA